MDATLPSVAPSLFAEIEAALCAYPGMETVSKEKLRWDARSFGSLTKEAWLRHGEELTPTARHQLASLRKQAAKFREQAAKFQQHLELLAYQLDPTTEEALIEVGFLQPDRFDLEDACALLATTCAPFATIERVPLKAGQPQKDRPAAVAIRAGKIVGRRTGKGLSYSNPTNGPMHGPFIGLLQRLFQLLGLENKGIEAAVRKAANAMRGEGQGEAAE